MGRSIFGVPQKIDPSAAAAIFAELTDAHMETASTTCARLSPTSEPPEKRRPRSSGELTYPADFTERYAEGRLSDRMWWLWHISISEHKHMPERVRRM
jgi:hypothetical protein